MRPFLLALALLAGGSTSLTISCSSEPEKRPRVTPRDWHAKPAEDLAPATETRRVGSASDARDVAELDPWNGKEISVEGTFDHVKGVHGIIKLDSGLTIFLNHFDQFAQGTDWRKYVGNRCSASGILHTYVKNIEGYHGPRLEIFAFSGSEE